ncbi:glycoside hydrolase family 3 protein [Alteromonas halophila]|uniref:beta-N-acetylhexosaminidase n=1 Tax=Alteromonas halophila TaxID=516698 RepID=A0A918JG99_9ALTE|nr:glycoside hydrolase family 3 protein [Alteromonas halophila]GGW79469.1 beta-N-acetylhexosaminidase [Alteromonas halophila]
MRYFCLLAVCVFSLFTEATTLSPVQKLGQKTIIDLRYFCVDGTPADACRTPFTHITAQNRQVITDLLTEYAVGGVILFAENIESSTQLITLNYELQSIMRKAGLPPLFIAIDQEGGRVARLPEDMAVRFSGNMAIGATYAKSGTRFAKDVAKGMASTLKRLGINVNFAPSLDVNSNSDNPVINVRSYGEQPAMVAALGEAAVRAMQQQGVISAVKHFPGHGDTHTDSHSHLPRVTHDRATIDKQDLLPFKRVIRDAAPAMVMTAHIQYPALDSDTVVSQSGKETIVPATMSSRILTDLLRDQLKFKGLIVSDAMDMAGITTFFSPQQALATAFAAGVDVALMPLPLRVPDDITGFGELLASVEKLTQQQQNGKARLEASLARIRETKTAFSVGAFINTSLTARLASAKNTLPQPSNLALDRDLSRQAITRITPSSAVTLSQQAQWLFVMPDQAHCVAARAAATAKNITSRCLSYFSLPPSEVTQKAVAAADAIIVGDITPQHAIYETGGLDPQVPRATLSSQHAWLKAVMKTAQSNHKNVVFVAMRAPYIVTEMAPFASQTLASYFYNVGVTGQRARSVMFDSLTEVLLGNQAAQGTLPVTVPLAPAR